jgi:hypothetical protein
MIRALKNLLADIFLNWAVQLMDEERFAALIKFFQEDQQ